MRCARINTTIGSAHRCVARVHHHHAIDSPVVRLVQPRRHGGVCAEPRAPGPQRVLARVAALADRPHRGQVGDDPNRVEQGEGPREHAQVAGASRRWMRGAHCPQVLRRGTHGVARLSAVAGRAMSAGARVRRHRPALVIHERRAYRRTAAVAEASSALEMSPPPHPANKADDAAITAKWHTTKMLLDIGPSPYADWGDGPNMARAGPRCP